MKQWLEHSGEWEAYLSHPDNKELLAAKRIVDCEVVGDEDFNEGDSTQKKSAPKEQNQHSKQ